MCTRARFFFDFVMKSKMDFFVLFFSVGGKNKQQNVNALLNRGI